MTNGAMSVVLAKASELGFKVEPRDKRTLYLDGGACQVIKTRWFENFPQCRAMSMYTPRNGFADFLLYVPEGFETIYVVPRGKIAHDTGWAESALRAYKDAWHLLKENAPSLFERKVESLSGQLRKIIAEAEKHKLPYRSKKGEQRNDYRTYMQRRILMRDKRCAIFTANLLPENTHPWPAAIFHAPKDDGPEILLSILGDDVYVVPRSQMPHETSLDLESSRIYDYKNAFCVLEGIDPTSSKQMAEYRLRIEGQRQDS